MSPFGLKELTGRVSGLYSDEQKKYLKGLGKCPACETRGAADLIDGSGTVLGKLDLRKAVKPTGEPLFARCKHCEGTWPIFAERTPELTIVVVPTRQGQGIGPQLLTALLDRARYEGYPAVSVSVQRGHADEAEYLSRGFAAVDEDGDAVTLLKHL